jgi:hypothetical protein
VLRWNPFRSFDFISFASDLLANSGTVGPIGINHSSVIKKVNFALEQAMKAQRESRGIALLFL